MAEQDPHSPGPPSSGSNSQGPGLDRRAWLRGDWRAPAAVEIASILVQARPEQLDAAERAIAAMPGTEIHARDPRGKLVVVIEASEVGAIGDALNTIALLPDVITATLVYHATDSA